MKIITTGVILAVALIFSGDVVLAQTTVVLPAAKDNTLYESPTGAASNGQGGFTFVGRLANRGGGELRRTLTQYDIAGTVPAGATITRAELTLTMDRTRTGATDISMHRVTSDWGEGTSDAPGREGQGTASTTDDATWIHAFFGGAMWGAPGGDFTAAGSSTASVAGNGDYTWLNLVADAQDMLDNPGTNYGWILIGDEANLQTAKRFESRNVGNIAKPIDRLNDIQRAVPGLLIEYNALPVELDRWTAGVDNGTVNLAWTTLSESDNSGFEVQTLINNSFEAIGFVSGNGDSRVQNDYLFSHRPVGPGKHFYRLKQVDFAGSFSYSPILEVSLDFPSAIYLSNAYPNPFNPSTTVTIGLAIGGDLEIQLLNALGHVVKRIGSFDLSENSSQEIQIDASELPSGIYYLLASSGEHRQTKRLVLLK